MNFSRTEKSRINYLLIFYLIIWSFLLIPVINALFKIKDFTINDLFKFYPLLFIFLFYKSKKEKLNAYDYIETGIYFLIFLISKIQGIMSGIWISGLLIFMILLKIYGINVHFFGRLLLWFVPPFEDKISLVLGFNLRLILTKIIGFLFHLMRLNITTSGNLIIYNGNEFVIDPACEGLKMSLALLIVLFFILYNLTEKNKSGIKLFFIFMLFISVSFLTWLFSNLVRIIILIIFNVNSETMLHYLIGLLTLFFISILPLWLIFEFFKTWDNKKKSDYYKADNRNIIISFIILALLIFLNLSIKTNPPGCHYSFPQNLSDFNKIETIQTKSSFSTDYEIAVYENSLNRLIIKNNLYPLRLIHSPRQCWTGEGFKIIRERKINIRDRGSVQELSIEKENSSYKLFIWYQPLDLNEKSTDSEILWRKKWLFNKTQYLQCSLFINANSNEEKNTKAISMIMNSL